MKNITSLFFLLLFSVLQTTFSQNSWVELTTGVTSRLNDISSRKGIAVWACGENATIIRSTNSGDTWFNANNSVIPAGRNLTCVFGINPEAAFTAGFNGINSIVYKTINGGTTWLESYQIEDARVNGIYMYDQNEGILVAEPQGGRWGIYKTFDGGSTWDSAGLYVGQLNNESGFIGSFWATGTRIWFGTNNTRIHTSDDLGTSWQVLLTGSEQNSRSVWFDYNYNMGYTGGNSIINSSNYGTSWGNLLTPGSGVITGITSSGTGRLLWFTRYDNKIFYSPFYGEEFELSYTIADGKYTGITIERDGFFGGAVYAIRDNGGISRTFFFSIGIEPISTEIPENFSLLQNYPNPFNPTTNFEFSITEFGPVNLTIFDVMGREVKTLLNTDMQPGTYKVNWSAAEYPSGVYFYRLTAGEFTETKKMLIIK
jgi:photosystem II stability/assembly factor-like uncharacterized protein